MFIVHNKHHNNNVNKTETVTVVISKEVQRNLILKTIKTIFYKFINFSKTLLQPEKKTILSSELFHHLLPCIVWL